jgi:hypothetical protein
MGGVLMAGVNVCPSHDKQSERQPRRTGALVAFVKGDFEGVDGLAVADAFELAVELGGGVVGIALVVVFGGFGLALLESVVEIGLGEGLEGEQGEAEGGGGGVEASVVFVGGLLSAVLEALEEENGREKRDKGEKGTVDDEVEVHGCPFAGG